MPSVQVQVEAQVATYETYQYLYPGGDARYIPLKNITVLQNPVGVVPAGPPAVIQPPQGQPPAQLAVADPPPPPQPLVPLAIQPQVLAPTLVPLTVGGYPYVPRQNMYRRR